MNFDIAIRCKSETKRLLQNVFRLPLDLGFGKQKDTKQQLVSST